MKKLRTAGLLALVLGTIAALFFMFMAGRNNRSIFLLVLFSLWTPAPFVALALADRMSARWSDTTRMTLYAVMIIVAIGSVTCYLVNFMHPPKSQAAFAFVAVPAVSWILILSVIPLAAVLSRPSK